MKPRLVYCCDANLGGIYEYGRWQAAALAAADVEVTFLCRKDYPGTAVAGCRMERRLPPKGATNRSRWRRAAEVIRSERVAAREAMRLHGEARGAHLLGACYREYLSPFWAAAFRRARGSGMCFATVAHDPVRDFVVGPRWWHQWSVAQAYSFVTQAFAHDDTPLDTGRPMPGLRVTVIPHGPYPLPAPTENREARRAQLGIRAEDVVFLAFGHIRDGKNLDLFLRALPRLPERVRLLVVGKESSTSQRPASYYQGLAGELGVAGRCRWEPRYVSGAEAANFFAAADFCLLTYDRNFRSASGVLNTASAYRKPVLASSGGGPLRQAVINYRLGVWMEPDSVDAIVAGTDQLLAQPLVPDWPRYDAENSWERNAALVRAALFGTGGEPGAL